MAQAKQDAAHAQAQADALKHQQDTQTSLAAEVTKLKDTAKAAAAKSAAKKAAAAKAAKAQARMTSCGGNLSAGPGTTCAFAFNVESGYYDNGGGNSRFDVYSPVTGLYYTMTCIPGVPTVCRGGTYAVVYIR